MRTLGHPAVPPSSQRGQAQAASGRRHRGPLHVGQVSLKMLHSTSPRRVELRGQPRPWHTTHAGSGTMASTGHLGRQSWQWSHR